MATRPDLPRPVENTQLQERIDNGYVSLIIQKKHQWIVPPSQGALSTWFSEICKKCTLGGCKKEDFMGIYGKVFLIY